MNNIFLGKPSRTAEEFIVNTKSVWTISFSDQCPLDFKDLVIEQNVRPIFTRNPSNPDYGAWGQVDIWKDDAKKNGYVNTIIYGKLGLKTLTFSYDIVRNGITVAEHAFTATFLKVNLLRSHLKEIWLDGFDENYEGLPVTTDDASKLSMFGACSSVRKGDFHGRNFDFTYDDRQTCMIHVGGTNLTHAFNCIVKDMFAEDTYVRKLPNMLVDGINDRGVCVNINVVSKKDLDDLGEGFANVNGTNPGAKRVHMLCAPCMILATTHSAVDAVKAMTEVDIYGNLVGLEHVHFMISDMTDTFVVEVIGDKLHVIGFEGNAHHIEGETILSKPVMTNWYLNWHLFPKDKLVREKYTENGCGTERHDLLSTEYEGAEASVKGLSDLMQAARFTNEVILDPATDEFYPFSDFGWGAKWTQEDYLNNLEFKARADEEIANVKKALDDMDRTKGIWITSHSTTYDLKNKTMRLVFEEDYDKPMSFAL